jgi:hypothetical protein
MAEHLPERLPRGYPNGQAWPPQVRRQALQLRAVYEGTSLEPRVAKFRAVADPLDCLEELAVCRAMLEDFLANMQQQNEWARMWARAKVEGTEQPPPPTRWLYPDEGLKYIKLIAEVATRIQELRQQQETVTRHELRQQIFRMAQAVEHAVEHVQLEDGWRVTLLKEIDAAWKQILI